MEDKDLALIAATILAGIIGGERVSADDKTIKRAVDAAYKMQTLLEERRRLAAAPPVPPVPPATPL